MKKRILHLLLAGIIAMSSIAEAGSYTAYAGQVKLEESAMQEEQLLSDDMEREISDQDIEKVSVSEEVSEDTSFAEKNEADVDLVETEEAAETAEETVSEGETSAEIQDGEKKQYIVTMSEDIRQPEIEVAEVISEESADEISIQEAEQILEEAAPEEILKENTEALEEHNMLLLELGASDVQELEQLESVEAVEEDVDMTAAALPDDSLFDDSLFGEEEYDPFFLQTKDVEEWNREMIHLEGSGEGAESTEGTGMRVAVLDSGVNLVADVSVAESVNLVDDEQSMEGFFMDGTGHGTAVAGIIGAQDDGQGITGIDPSAEILSIRILDCQNRCSLSRLIAGIKKAEEMEADIICMSLGTAAKSVALEKAVTEAQEKGILLIAAAGNGETVEYPAAYDAVISVGSVNHDGELATESSGREEIDLLAPGEDVAATDTFFGADYLSGTSMAAPHVAGVASLLWKKDKNMSAEFIRNLLKLSAAGVGDGEAGVVDYAYALSIYEEYKQQYDPEEQTEESSLQNTQEVEAVDMDENVVEARWGIKNHVTLMENTLKRKDEDGSLMYEDIDEECRKALLTGAVLPDNKFKAEGGYFFHGGKHNFLAYYKFLCQLAKRIKNRSDDHTAVRNIMKNLSEYYPKRSDGSAFPTAEKDSVTGTTLGQFDMLAEALNNVYTEWNSYVRYKENVTDKNDTGEQVKKTDLAMSYVIIGMAIHSATDTYAHRAGIKKDGEWVAVKTNDEDHDKLEQGGARAKAAQITCNRTLKRFHGKENDCVAPFLIEGLDGYGGNGAGAFRLRNYQKCADEITDNYKNKLGKYSYTK